MGTHIAQFPMGAVLSKQTSSSNFGIYNRSCTLVNDRYLTFMRDAPTNTDPNKEQDPLFGFYDIQSIDDVRSAADTFDIEDSDNNSEFLKFDPKKKGYTTPDFVKRAWATGG